MDATLAALIESALGARAEVLKVEHVQSLWAGYGSIRRIFLKQTPNLPKTVILKEVAPPRSADASDVGHRRKLRSYTVERAFYASGAGPALLRAGAPIPQPLSVSPDDAPLRLLMSDLRTEFPRQVDDLDLLHAKSVLAWLAAFHAHFWGQSHQRPQGLWEQGGYWHLGTRREELARVSSRGQWAALKAGADSLDLRLQGYPDGRETSERDLRFRTLVHGDPKSENCVFAAKSAQPGVGPPCAFYDFQYVGEGYGAVDVAYVLATSTDRAVVQRSEKELLQWYHTQLLAALEKMGEEDAADYTFEVLFSHYELALADWLRFLVGWGMWGNTRWLQQRVKQTGLVDV